MMATCRRGSLRSGLVATIALCLIGTIVIRSYVPLDMLGAFNSSSAYRSYIITSTTNTTRTNTTTTTCAPVAHEASNMDTLRYVYGERLRVATDTCFGRKLGGVKRIMREKQNRIANCIVPKVGCTYWINIFRFLNNETGGKTYDTPFDIPRYLTHYGKKTKDEAIKINETGPSFLTAALRFMFVREPYSRLWSAWIDKFWLPDFWIRGKTIATALNLTGSCRMKNITFTEFLRHVTLPNFIKYPASLNEHWVPYKHICDPCIFRPHVIGKIETFSQDSRYILQSTNLTWVLDPPKETKDTNDTESSLWKNKHTDHSVREMRLLTEYNVNTYFREKVFRNCSSLNEVYGRVWKAFQYNGHLPADVPYPVDEVRRGNLSMETFLNLTEKTYTSWTERSKSVQAKQKKDAMLEAYRVVPTDIMKKLQTIYAIDFEMFEYEKEPKELYEYR